MKVKAIIHQAEEGGFWAEVPALPGCVTQGETEEEVTSNLREAVELWLSVDTTDGEVVQNDRIIELALRNRFRAKRWQGPFSGIASSPRRAGLLLFVASRAK